VGIKTAIAVKPKRAEAKIQNLITEAQFKEALRSVPLATSVPSSAHHISESVT
jgi:hypothetical protein